MRCLKPGFIPSHDIRGRSETRFDDSVSRPDLCVVTVALLVGSAPVASVRFTLRPSFQPFFRPAVPTRPVFTSPHFLPSRASRSQRLALAVLVLVGASFVRFQLSAGRCRAVFAFPVRREDSMPNGIHRVKKIYSVLNIRGQKNTP